MEAAYNQWSYSELQKLQYAYNQRYCHLSLLLEFWQQVYWNNSLTVDLGTGMAVVDKVRTIKLGYFSIVKKKKELYCNVN